MTSNLRKLFHLCKSREIKKKNGHKIYKLLCQQVPPIIIYLVMLTSLKYILEKTNIKFDFLAMVCCRHNEGKLLYVEGWHDLHGYFDGFCQTFGELTFVIDLGPGTFTGGFTKPWHHGLVAGYILQPITAHDTEVVKNLIG